MFSIIGAGSSLGHGDLVTLFLAVAVLIGFARILGEVAQKFKQPSILGELLAGIILGPSILGMLAPDINNYLFPSSGPVRIGLDFISSLAIALFLLLAGMEIDLRSVWKQGKTALSVSFGGMIIPFVLGLALALGAPELLGMTHVENKTAFSLFFATALSITALPVIARILMDLKLIKSHMGITVLTAAILNDLIGWLIFAAVLGMIGASGASHGITFTMTATIVFAGLMFTVGTKLMKKTYPWIQANFSWPAGTLSFIVVGALLCAAFTEWIGIHAIFGTFIFGVSIGQCPHIREKTHYTLESFISFIFTPIFFASIGLQVNFFANFDWQVVMIVLLIGTIGKIGGSWLGGKIGGLNNRESFAIGCGMNARGVMEIILGLIAFQVGLINEALFVALVVLALFTSMTSGALMQKILRRRASVKLKTLLKKDQIFFDLDASSRDDLLKQMSEKAATKASLDQEEIYQLMLNREDLDSTGLNDGIAMPHCRLADISEPKVFMGFCPDGVDFLSPDQSRSKVIFMIITNEKDFQSQLEIISQIATLFQERDNCFNILKSQTPTEVIAFINSYQKA
jgi:Kef-type K+ transport system membrane component KefB/mannitol/fructose-specific phosphotransferase system IIA component (Ntr-type)